MRIKKEVLKINKLIDNDLLDLAKSPEAKIIEISGHPDSGRTRSAFKLANEISEKDSFYIYFAVKKRLLSQGYYDSMVPKNYGNNMVFAIAESFEDVRKTLQNIMSLGEFENKKIKLGNIELKAIVIDDACEYLLNQNKREIMAIMNFLNGIYSLANIKTIIVNELRYNIDEKEREKTPLKPLYFNHLDPVVSLRLKVSLNDENMPILTRFQITKIKIDLGIEKPKSSLGIFSAFKQGV